MKIKYKLYIISGSLLLLTIILSGIALKMLYQSRDDMHVIVGDRYEKVRLVNIIRYEINDTSRMLRGLILLDRDKESIEKTIQSIEKSRENTLIALNSLDKVVKSDQVKELMPKLKILNDSFIEFQKKIQELVKQGKRDEATEVLLTEGSIYRENMFQIINKIVQIQEQIMRDKVANIDNSYRKAVQIYVTLIILGLFITAGVAIITTRKITLNIKEVTGVLNSISSIDKANNLPRININSNDEIKEIAKAFNKMAATLENQIQKEKDYNKKIQEQGWLKEKLAEISTMYQGIKEIKTFGEQLLAKLTPLVGGSYGVFYLIEGQDEQKYLKKISAYAFDNRAMSSPDFLLGEGLVGQCALENKVKLIKEVPENYIKINSGLGAAAPQNIIILPVEFEGQVLAVIELASLEEFSPIQRDLLNQALKNVGIIINRITDHMLVQKLLKESQALTEELQSQTEELQTQSEELQLQQEELRTVNEKIEEQYIESRQKAAELEKVKLSLEEKARELAQSSRYKSEFLSNMSHELRTPLNSLLVLAQILAKNDSKNLTAKQVEYAETILSSGQDLLYLINDILDLSKIESGKMEIFTGEVKLKAIKDFAERHFQPVAQTKNLKFSIWIDKDLPDTIYTDEQKLQQILKNLLANAFKFTERGSIKLNFRKAKTPGRYENGVNFASMLAVSVQDTGIGIPREKHDMIFEEFQQADGTTSRKYGGSGLGLSISLKFASLLGGFIELESQEGEGTTFTLYLPLSLPNTLSKKVKVDEVAAGLEKHFNGEVSEVIPIEYTDLLEGCRILIVDDDMRNVFALTTALENHKVNVLFAENGKSGIKTLEKNPGIDLVLMDMMMPEMDGYEAIKIIRQNPEYQKLPIIALTAKAMKNDREKCINAGASDYISKPVNLEQLFSLMKVWLYK